MAYKLKVTFSKTGSLSLISHLDLMRLLQRASRRARMPLALTQGFSPHLKISIAKALKLGVESPAEEALFSMSEAVDADTFIRSMNSALPEGVRMLRAEAVS